MAYEHYEERKPIAEVIYVRPPQKVCFYDIPSYIKELTNALDTYGINAIQTNILDKDNWDLRYEKERVLLDMIGEDIEPKDIWIAKRKADAVLKPQSAVEEQKPFEIKVILDNGIVSCVLKNQDRPIHVEVVDCNDDYSDIEKLKEYRDSIYADKSFIDCDYNTANFEEFEEDYDIPPDPAKVFAVSGCVKHVIYSGTKQECIDFCAEHNWSFVDENRFEWDMEIEEDEELEHEPLEDKVKEAQSRHDAPSMAETQDLGKSI